MRRRLKRTPGLAVVIQVPDESWTGAFKNYLHRLIAHEFSTVARTGAMKLQDPSNGNDGVGTALAAGTTVIGVSQSPASHLPRALTAAVDITITIVIGPPTGAVITQAMRRCLACARPRAGDVNGYSVTADPRPQRFLRPHAFQTALDRDPPKREAPLCLAGSKPQASGLLDRMKPPLPNARCCFYRAPPRAVSRPYSNFFSVTAYDRNPPAAVNNMDSARRLPTGRASAAFAVMVDVSVHTGATPSTRR